MSSVSSLRKLTSVMAQVRSIYADIPATTIQLFLVVATNPGVNSKDLHKKVGGSPSAISRHLSLLGDYTIRGEVGLQLVESIEDPEDRRNKLTFLTLKGRQLAVNLMRIMVPEGQEVDQEIFTSASAYVSRYRGAR